jgi:soluble lytic murein transglycosylase-like protein
MAISSVCAAAHAVGNADYLTVRNRTALTTLADSRRLTDQFPALAGQVLEIQGVVSGVFSGDASAGYLLRLDETQTLILSAKQDDRDIAVGNTLRVLARIPPQGTVLQSLTVTRMGADLARADLSTLRVDNQSVSSTAADTAFTVTPNTQPPTMTYYTAPAFSPTPAQPAQSAMADQPLSKQPVVVQLYAAKIHEINANVDGDTAISIATHLLAKSEAHSVDPRLVFALVMQESRFNPNAVSSAGAQGLGQLMPGTASMLGVRNSFDIEDNLEGTVSYIADQLNQFGRLSLALAAYNAGPGNVRKYGGVPPFRETQRYVSVIWRNYAKFAGLNPETGEQIASR